MMTVHKIAGVDSCGYASYLASRDGASRRGDYYLGREGQQAEAPGMWHGRGAAELGLEGEVSRETLLRTWEGKDPGTGEIVVRRSVSGEECREAAAGGRVRRVGLAGGLQAIGDPVVLDGREGDLPVMSPVIRVVVCAQTREVEEAVAVCVAEHGRRARDHELKELVF